MMRKLWSAIGVMLAVTGCLHGNESPAAAEPDPCRDRGEGIVAAIVTGDHGRFAAAAREPEVSGDAERFRKDRETIIRRYGQPTGFRFLTDLQTPLLVNQIWVVDFVRRDRDGQEIRQQQLFQLIFGEKDRHMRMLGMRFI